jgi:hypothetical protein
MAFDNSFADEIAEIDEAGEDMSVAQSGGGNYTPPAVGLGYARFVQYVELGVHETTYNGKPKKVDQARLGFELIGKLWPANDEGVRPMVSFTMTKSLSEKAHFFKMFNRMNHDGKAKHMATLLGGGFKVEVTHTEKGEGADKRIYVNLRNKEGYTVQPAFKEETDEETMEVVTTAVKVPAPTRALQLFVWGKPSKNQWDSIFIDGERDDGTSKNWLQDLIKAALNYEGSPIQTLLGGAADIGGEAEKPSRTEKNKEAVKEAKASAKNKASEDPLND